MTNERRDRILYLVNINQYLDELHCLTDKNITKNDLTDPVATKKIFEGFLLLKTMSATKWSIPFSEKETHDFKKFITELHNSNSNKIYIWTPRSQYCGFYKTNSISSINMCFPFNINKEGMLSFIPEDFRDEILLDFSINTSDKKELEINIKGYKWPTVKYNSPSI